MSDRSLEPPTASGGTLQGNLMSGSAGAILNAIGNAEEHLGRHEIKFPRIAVFGDESTGKSSVLEAICQIPFPRGHTTTTRCPIQVRLVRTSGKPWSASVWIGNDRANQVRVTQPQDVTEVIRKKQQENIDEVSRKNVRGGAQFSHVAVTVLVESEDVLDLTLLDLPGYFIHEGRDANTPQGDVIRIKTMLMDCMKDHRTILLVVLKSNQVFKTANIFNLLKEYESSLTKTQLVSVRARTIYCVTMCDLVSGPNAAQQPPQDVETILDNSGPFAAHPHGWFAVVNNKGRTMGIDDFHSRLAADRQLEAEFFDTVSPYNKSHLRALCGTENLIEKLSTLLSREISNTVEAMKRESDQALNRMKKELASYGPPPQQARNVTREFYDIIEDIKRYYKNVCNGDYNCIQNEVPKPIQEERMRQCSLGGLRSKRCKDFALAVEKARLPIGAKSYIDHVRREVEKSKDGKLEQSLPGKEVIINEIRRCAHSWRALAEGLCNDIARAAGSYQTLPGILKKHLDAVIEEQKELALDRLEWHYVDEICRPDSMNKDYEKVVKDTSFPGIGKESKSTAEAYVKNLEAYFKYAEARYADNVIRSVTTHIFDVPLNEGLTRVKLLRGNDFTHIFQSHEVQKGHKIEEMLKLRDNLGAQRKAVEVKVEKLEKLSKALGEHNQYRPSLEEEEPIEDARRDPAPVPAPVPAPAYSPADSSSSNGGTAPVEYFADAGRPLGDQETWKPSESQVEDPFSPAFGPSFAPDPPLRRAPAETQAQDPYASVVEPAPTMRRGPGGAAYPNVQYTEVPREVPTQLRSQAGGRPQNGEARFAGRNAPGGVPRRGAR